MRIRRFEAPDTKTALTMVKKEMGEDAVILSSKPILNKNNRMRNGRPWLEIVAAMDYDLESFTTASGQHEDPPKVIDGPAINFQSHPPSPPTSHHPAPARSGLSDILANDVKNEARELSLRFAGRSQAQSKPGAKQTTASLRPKPNPQDVAQWRDQLIDQISIRPLAIDPQPGATPKIITLLGATGVGKTTTAAKIAAWFTIHENRKVALISMDCYRIGATDQLRTYAKIMRIPCEVVLHQSDLQQTIARHRDKDLIIIDTAGKSPYDRHHIAELQETFAPINSIAHQLVLSATAKKEDLAAVIAAYAPLTIEGLIVTKIDETRAYAILCQQIANASIPLSCLCTGQRVPEDFLLASKAFIDKLFREGWPAVAGNGDESAMTGT
ncbi:flagellar biosynthesis protein FlhF [Thermodesulfobacteriota bacterium]